MILNLFLTALQLTVLWRRKQKPRSYSNMPEVTELVSGGVRI